MTDTVPETIEQLVGDQTDEQRIAELEQQVAENAAWKTRMVDVAIRYAEQNGYERQVRDFLVREGFEAPNRYRVYLTRQIVQTQTQSAYVTVYAKTEQDARDRAMQLNATNADQGHFYWETSRYEDDPTESDVTVDRVRVYN